MPSPTTDLTSGSGAPRAVRRLKARADFVRVGKGRRWHGKAMTLQAAPQPGEGEPPRIGFTLTRKVGGAVIRNRARRRLREAVRLADGLQLRASHDYVILGRIDAIRLPFEDLKRELERAIRGVHGDARGTRATSPGSGPERGPDRTRPNR